MALPAIVSKLCGLAKYVGFEKVDGIQWRPLGRFFLTLTLTLPALFLSSCLFDTDSIVEANFLPELSGLKHAANPVAIAYGVTNNGDAGSGSGTGKSMVGLQFAFQSMNYAHEVDSNVAVFHQQTGVYPALVGAYFDYTVQAKNLRAFLDAAYANGCVPYVTLDPKYWANPDLRYQKTFLALTTQGKFDSLLNAVATTIRDFAHPVIIRFAHEMNGDWYPYAGGGDADSDGHADGPQAYIQAWRHVHAIFSHAGPKNHYWAFCPNAETFPDEEWNRPFRYYPGDEYVDLIFVDAYEHYSKRTQTLEQVLEKFYGELGSHLRSQASLGNRTDIPFGLGEFGTNRKEADAKLNWYVDALDSIGADLRIQFHFLYNAQNGSEDFSLRGLENLPGSQSGNLLHAAYQNLRFLFRLFSPA